VIVPSIGTSFAVGVTTQVKVDVAAYKLGTVVAVTTTEAMLAKPALAITASRVTWAAAAADVLTVSINTSFVEIFPPCTVPVHEKDMSPGADGAFLMGIIRMFAFEVDVPRAMPFEVVAVTEHAEVARNEKPTGNVITKESVATRAETVVNVKAVISALEEGPPTVGAGVFMSVNTLIMLLVAVAAMLPGSPEVETVQDATGDAEGVTRDAKTVFFVQTRVTAILSAIAPVSVKVATLPVTVWTIEGKPEAGAVKVQAVVEGVMPTG